MKSRRSIDKLPAISGSASNYALWGEQRACQEWRRESDWLRRFYWFDPMRLSSNFN
jgi:hypothetical protein